MIKKQGIILLFIFLTVIVVTSVYTEVLRTGNYPKKRVSRVSRVGGKDGRSTDEALTQEDLRAQAEERFNKGFDKQAKEKSVIDLVEKAKTYLQSHTFEQTCHALTHGSEFEVGEVYPFIIDMKGRLLAHGEQDSMIWSNMLDAKDSFGFEFVKAMIAKAKEGGGWVSYSWRNAIKVTYVQPASKGNNEYVLGAGYYPHTKADVVVGLVKGAVALFNEMMQKGYKIEDAFSSMSYPRHNRFIVGDLYLYALDFKGTILAQGERPGLIGENSLNYADATGKLYNKEIIQQLSEGKKGVWIEYVSKKAKKITYAEKVTDNEGKNYFIACGYYPEADRKAAEDLVGRAYQYMEAQGKTESIRAFTNSRDDTFRYGDLYIVVYDLKGTIIAHGANEEVLGRNAWNNKDDDGRLYVQEIIDKAQKGGGWIDYKSRNSFQSVYIEMVDLGVEKFVITTGMYPISKPETMMMLLKSAVSLFSSTDSVTALHEIVDDNGKFIRGDLKIFVFDTEGICYAWGDNVNLIWKNLLNSKDDKGRQYVKLFLNTVQFGSGKVIYDLHHRPAIAAVEKVEKDGKTFILGSHFYF